jgi:Pyridine nucleotide-disulphide oxidoreductase
VKNRIRSPSRPYSDCRRYPTASTPAIFLDGERASAADPLRELTDIPQDVIIVGAGVVANEYASMFTAMNIKVTVFRRSRWGPDGGATYRGEDAVAAADKFAALDRLSRL